MVSIASSIPDRFWNVRFDPDHDVNSPILKGFEESPNCQNFAYEILRHFGRSIPNLRSSNLWEDTEHTIVVSEYEPLDLLLFNRTPEPWGAHVALYVGDDHAIHLSREIGVAVVWPIGQFAERPAYRVLIGAKRTIR
jgi:lipoprotein Spr